MADYDCEWCRHEYDCPYLGNSSYCYIETIKAAKVVVTPAFKEVYSEVSNENGIIGDERIDHLVRYMHEIISDSEQELPEWAMEG